MGTRDTRVDAYIAKAPAFAQPILEHLRDVVHGACPEVEETLKWGMPHFLHNGMLCGMSAFKAHCAFGFWKHALVILEKSRSGGGGMGHFGRITSIADLPSKRVLEGYVRTAMKLNEKGVKNPARAPRKPKAPATVPPDFRRALAARDGAKARFQELSPSRRREYVEWVTEAKRDETRARRIETAVEWIGEGKSLNWRYEKR